MLINTGLIHALAPSDRRVFSRKEAASYVGVSVGQFDKLVRLRILPSPLPMPGVKRWDILAINKAIDAMSGISKSRNLDEDLDLELAEFEEKHGRN